MYTQQGSNTLSGFFKRYPAFAAELGITPKGINPFAFFPRMVIIIVVFWFVYLVYLPLNNASYLILAAYTIFLMVDVMKIPFFHHYRNLLHKSSVGANQVKETRPEYRVAYSGSAGFQEGEVPLTLSSLLSQILMTREIITALLFMVFIHACFAFGLIELNRAIEKFGMGFSLPSIEEARLWMFLFFLLLGVLIFVFTLKKWVSKPEKHFQGFSIFSMDLMFRAGKKKLLHPLTYLSGFLICSGLIVMLVRGLLGLDTSYVKLEDASQIIIHGLIFFPVSIFTLYVFFKKGPSE